MAEDIHDTVAQELNAIALFSEAAISEIIEDRDSAQRHIGRACDLAKECLANARRSMWTLASPLAESEDPCLGFSALAKRFFDGTDTKVELSIAKHGRKLPSQIQAAIYRIGSEVLANVLKHARARTVWIELAYRNGDAHLSVRDDGRGFIALPSTDARAGLGLWSIRERAVQFGGKVIVTSRPGHGTVVSAVLPLSSRLARGASA
jgi:signal transduction histidine kinase